MTTLLLYLVFAAIIGGVVFVAAVFLFGRGERMSPLPPRTSPAQLPSGDITGDDVRKVRFALAARGYRMSDVDWTLDRLSTQLDELWAENVRLRGYPADPAHGDDVQYGDDQDGDDARQTETEPVTVGAPPEVAEAGPVAPQPAPHLRKDEPAAGEPDGRTP